VGKDGDIDVFSGQFAGVGHFYRNLLNDDGTKSKYDNRLKKLSSCFLLENLFLSLKKFDHGEGMLMNINRLSLLVQNIGYTQKSSNVMKKI